MYFLYNFWVFVYVSFSHIAYVISNCTFAFLGQFQLNYSHTVYTDLLFIIVLHFVHIFYYTSMIFCIFVYFGRFA